MVKKKKYLPKKGSMHMQSRFGHNEMNNGVLRKTMTNSNYYDNKKRRKKKNIATSLELKTMLMCVLFHKS
jgi:hypothetical protein